MTNHIHLIAFPYYQDSLARTLATAHTHYSRLINSRTRIGGHLWQGRFFSCPLDDEYLIRAARYIELNPVRAGLVAKAADWLWSNARAYLAGGEDRLLAGASWPPEDLGSQWPEILSEFDALEILSPSESLPTPETL
jgi:putative transposase